MGKESQELFNIGSLEKVICGALTLALKSLGDITHQNKPSATKIVVGAVRGYLTDFNVRDLQGHMLEKEREALTKKKAELDRILPRLRQSRDDLIEKCRDANLI